MGRVHSKQSRAIATGISAFYKIVSRHKKTDLKVFVVVIPKERWARPLPKEGWARAAAPIPFLYDTNFLEFESFGFIDHILLKSVSYQKKDGRGHASPSFFWYDNDKDLKVCFLGAPHICFLQISQCMINIRKHAPCGPHFFFSTLAMEICFKEN